MKRTGCIGKGFTEGKAFRDFINALLKARYAGTKGLLRKNEPEIIAGNITALMEDKDNFGFFTSNGKGRIDGVIVVSVLKWDNAILGRVMAKAVLWGDISAGGNKAASLLSLAEEEAGRRGVGYFSLDAYATEGYALGALARRGYILEESKWKMTRDMAAYKTNGRVPGVREYAPGDKKSVAKIAYSDYSNRYLDNPFLESGKVRTLYAEWAGNCCSGRSDKVFVSSSGGGITGFIACNLDKRGSRAPGERTGIIDLIVLDRCSRGKKTGQALIKKGLDWFKENADIVKLEVAVNKFPAAAIYIKHGFRPQALFHVFSRRVRR
ncbi:MAG: GNAT family N-acetyltransferase [Candidatus Omnitrophica bacterium]|nr:GNAT family N-acetyltransferase [Candidatus Omnitrophota bacterium]